MTSSPHSVILRALAPGDEDAAVRWAADPEFCAAVDWTPGLSARTVRRHWQVIIAGRDPTFRRWGIVLDGTLIGYVDLGRITAHTAELGIAIGDRAWWGHGLARQACGQALALAWASGLAEVTALVHEPNARSRALMRRLGMTGTGWAARERYRGEIVRVRRYVIRRPGPA